MILVQYDNLTYTLHLHALLIFLRDISDRHKCIGRCICSSNRKAGHHDDQQICSESTLGQSSHLRE